MQAPRLEPGVCKAVMCIAALLCFEKNGKWPTEEEMIETCGELEKITKAIDVHFTEGCK